MKASGLIISAAVLACIALTSSAASFQGLGDLSGGEEFQEAFAVSADGTVVVGRSKSVNGQEAFNWTGGTLAGLGDLSGGIFGSEAHGISSDGLVIVGRGSSTAGLEAFRRTGAGMTGLGGLNPAAIDSEALAVSSTGSVIVGRSKNTNGKDEAFRWTSVGMVGLGDLSGGGFYSRATAVSEDGRKVVGVSLSGSGYEGFLWTQGGSMQGLGDLPGGGFMSTPEGISADGKIVVGSSLSSQGMQAFVWTSTNGMKPLGDLPGGTFYSVAKSVSRDGNVIVGFGTVTGTGTAARRAFMWDPIRGMRDLKNVLVNEYGLSAQLDDWTLREATAVTPDGRVIVGFGTHDDGVTPVHTEGWRVVLGRDDIDPSGYDWSDSSKWDEAMSFVELDSNSKVKIEVIKFVWVMSNFNNTHCKSGANTCLEHIHFANDVDSVAADRFWDWYYTGSGASRKTGSSATNLKESIAYGLHGYATGASYNYWLTHGKGSNQSNTAFTDCHQIVSPGYSDPIQWDRVVYDEGDRGYLDSVYDHVTIISLQSAYWIAGRCGGGWWNNYADKLEWKCGYSGVYEWNPTSMYKTYNTPGRTGTDYNPGESPVGTVTSDFWKNAKLFRKN